MVQITCIGYDILYFNALVVKILGNGGPDYVWAEWWQVEAALLVCVFVQLVYKVIHTEIRSADLV